MKAPATHFFIRRFQGFAVHTLRSRELKLAVVPELGAKIISLKNLRTGREWLWHPGDQLKLFKNRPHDEFSASPLAGMDECLPTILPCNWRGRRLPDHGEVWNQPWQVDGEAWRKGILTTRIRLKFSPFAFERSIELQGNEVQFGYQLSNLGAARENFIWAIHPLLKLTAGDELELPDSTRKLLNGEAWVNAVAAAIPARKRAKVFGCPVAEGWAAIKNEAHRDRLEFVWDPAENNALGLWLTRGGWHGHHHFAIEPTNAAADSLAVAAGQKRCGSIAARGTAAWRLSLRVGMNGRK